MTNDKPQRKSRGRRRRKGGNNRRAASERPMGPDCPLCGKPIRDVSAAIDDKESGRPAHFDCILTSVSGDQELEEGQKLIYLGSGTFGIIKMTGNRKFEILKKINYEGDEPRMGWRKEMRFQFPD